MTLMEHDRIRRIVELNKQLLKANPELVKAIRDHANPEAIKGIREAVKTLKGEIEEIQATKPDA